MALYHLSHLLLGFRIRTKISNHRMSNNFSTSGHKTLLVHMFNLSLLFFVAYEFSLHFVVLKWLSVFWSFEMTHVVLQVNQNINLWLCFTSVICFLAFACQFLLHICQTKSYACGSKTVVCFFKFWNDACCFASKPKH